MVEWQPHEFHRGGRPAGDCFGKGDCLGNAGCDLCRLAEIVHHDHFRDGCQLFGNGCQFPGHFDLLAVVPVAVAGNEHLGFDLTEPVEYAVLAEIGRTG